MAIAFARSSIHTRSKGHSAVAAAAYRSGGKLLDERTGVIHDFSNRHDVVYSEIMLPAGASAAYENRAFLWNQVEASEKRLNSQLCKDIVLALPKELDEVQQIELARRFAEHHFVSNGLVADIAIHNHGDGNPHAHILVTTRRLEREGFSKYKARDLNPAFAKGKVVEQDYWGEQWRDMQNEFFLESQINLKVDPNHLIPERHHGRLSGSESHYLKEEKALIREARKEVLLNDPESLINHLSAEHSVFTRRDAERLLFKTFDKSEEHQQYLQLIEKLIHHKDIIHLGQNEKGEESYTTRQQYKQEAKLLSDIESLMQKNRGIDHFSLLDLAQQYQLNDEQKDALNYIAESSDISLVVGRPGVGKSYLLKPVKEYFERQNHRVIGAALAGKVAKALQADTGMESYTLASIAYRINKGQLQLTSHDVIIVDEAGMVDFAHMSFLIRQVKKAGAKIVLVGDPDQLKPIHKGEIFRGIAAHTGYIELEQIRRQKDAGDRQASLDLAHGRVDKAIEHYDKKNAIIYAYNKDKAIDAVIGDWQQEVSKETVKDNIMLSFTRKSVRKLNIKARDALLEKGLLGQSSVTYRGENTLLIAEGERLLFKENDKKLGLRNGDVGTVLKVDEKRLEVRLDSGEKLTVPNTYKGLDYGYALTVHKSQGMTIKNSFVLIDSKFWNRNLAFVAMTRHKDKLKIYTNNELSPDRGQLAARLSKTSLKANVLDWQLNLATRLGFEPDRFIGKIISKAEDLVNLVKKPSKQAKKENDSIEIPDALKKEFPVLAQYEEALKKRENLSGYWAEKKDNEIFKLSQKIKSDQKIIEKISISSPKFYSKIMKPTVNMQKTELTRE